MSPDIHRLSLCICYSASLSPMSWVRDKLRFQQRLEKMRTKVAEDSTSEESKASGKRQAKLEGKQSLFETTGVQDTKSISTPVSATSKVKALAVPGAKPKKSKKRAPTSVCACPSIRMPPPHSRCIDSMNMRRLYSRCRTVN